MRVYQPSNTVTASGMVVFSLFAIISGILTGLVCGFLSGKLMILAQVRTSKLLMMIIILVVLGAGFVAGGLMNMAVKTGKVRFPTMAMVGGGLFTVVAAICTVIVYMDTGIKSPWGWLMLGSEIFAIGIGAIFVPSSAAEEPFCETCEQWFGKEQFLKNFPFTVRPQLVAFLKANNILRAEQLITAQANIEGNFELAVRSCRCANSKTVLLINKVELKVDEKGNKNTTRTTLVKLHITPEEQNALMTALAGAPAGPVGSRSDSVG